MIKKILISLVILAIICAAAAYIYRQAIVQYYGEKFIRDNLPGYVKIDKIKFDLGNNVFSIGGLKILNPPGFISKYALAIQEVRCVYRIKGAIIPKGLNVTEISFKKPEVAVERLRDGRVNLAMMGDFISSFPVKAPAATPEPPVVKAVDSKTQAQDSPIKLHEIIKLPASYSLREGRIYFIDSVPHDQPYEIIAGSVNGEVTINFNKTYTGILNAAFTLEGELNDVSSEKLKWTASIMPTTPRLTMSNRFEVSGIDILIFEPYYDAQSPIVFKKGKFSGDLVFDFDNGNIGSDNVITLSDVLFWVKEGRENGQFWDSSVPDLIKYFTATSGNIVFDFKIKGDMDSPRFYLGPISKRALTSMAIDKISSYAMDQLSKPADAVSGGTVNKANDYINMVKELIKKR